MMLGFEIGISYQSMSLQDLIYLNADNRICALALESMAGSYDPDPQKALVDAGKQLFPIPSDRKLYRAFIRGLGASGVQETLQHVRVYAAMTEEALEAARSEEIRQARLAVVLGLFFGILPVLAVW